MPAAQMIHDSNPYHEMISNLGNISGVEVFNNQVLVGVYIRPNKTKSGIYLADSTRDEDRYQGKVGAIIKMGDKAFLDQTGTWFEGQDFNEGDWVFFRPSDGWGITVNGVLCRILEDINIRGRVPRPDMVY